MKTRRILAPCWPITTLCRVHCLCICDCIEPKELPLCFHAGKELLYLPLIHQPKCTSVEGFSRRTVLKCRNWPWWTTMWSKYFALTFKEEGGITPEVKSCWFNNFQTPYQLLYKRQKTWKLHWTVMYSAEVSPPSGVQEYWWMWGDPGGPQAREDSELHKKSGIP